MKTINSLWTKLLFLLGFFCLCSYLLLTGMHSAKHKTDYTTYPQFASPKSQYISNEVRELISKHVIECLQSFKDSGHRPDFIANTCQKQANSIYLGEE